MWGELSERIAPILAQDLDAETMITQALLTVTGYQHEEAPLSTQLHAALLSGAGIGAEAVQDTLVPLLDDVEAAIRRAAGSP